MFSRRTGWNLAPNRLASALAARRRSGSPLLDLTASNPTRAGIEYPSGEIARALAEGSAAAYDPDPRGDPAARLAISRWYRSRGFAVEPDRIVLTPGTSEAYGWLFKLLCDPGDRVLIPRPSYPLFEFLATLESVETAAYPLHYETRWDIDRQALLEILEAPGAARAIVAVNPNNPTGSYLSRSDAALLLSLARERGLAIVSDEVFSSFPIAERDTPASAECRLPPGAPGLDRGSDPAPADPGRGPTTRPFTSRPGAAETLREPTTHPLTSLPGADEAFPGSTAQPLTSLLGSDEAPAFVLDGISKSAGMPGMKIGWIVVLGPAAFRAAALARLDVIADTYLPVASAAQRALPRLLELGGLIAARIRERIRRNDAALRSALPVGSPCEALRTEGGWSAVLRVPRTIPEEDLCLRLLEQDGVLVQPGWFFDFASEAYLVLSLLTPEPDFREGLARILARAR